jgi:Phosphotransferase enzyme family
MAPGPDTEFAAVVAAVCPRFVPGARVHARKSELLAGELDGAPVIAKRLARPSAVWAWYLARELAIYRAFDAAAPPIRVPRLYAADDARGVLVIERLPGPQLARRRSPRARLAPGEVAALLELRRRFARWTGVLPSEPPPPAVLAQLRARLLEDPTAPLGWVRAGVARCGERGLLDRDTARRIDDALAAHDRIAPSHGDLLLRNAVRDGDRIGLVDWECAGLHPEDWDLALVWAQLAPAARGPIEAEVRAAGTARWRAFLGLAAFALAREVSFLHTFRVAPDHAGLARLRAEIAAVAVLLG